MTSGISLQLKGGSNPKHTNRQDLYKSVIKWGSDDDFIFIDADNETPKPDCTDELIPDEINKKLFRARTLTMPATETANSDATGAGSNDQNYDDAKSALLLPFSMYSSSIDTGYRQTYVTGTMPKIEFANMHDDKYGFDAEVPMQGPFTEKNVGGMQHRHVDLNRHDPVINSTTTNKIDSPLTRPEGWHLQEFLDQDFIDYLFQEWFTNATTTATTDVSILALPYGDISGEPSEHEYWKNGVGADNSWTFLKGPTPSAGTGPGGSAHATTTYAYCEVQPSKVGQTFSLVSPLVDLLEVDSGDVKIRFSYHMHGIHIGNLKVQASQDPNFEIDVEDLLVDWGTFQSTVISGQQHTNEADSFTTNAEVGSTSSGNGLANWLGKRFYIRFFYTAGISHLGDCAIDRPRIYKGNDGIGITQNSFKLLNPTYDNHHRPSAIYTRQEFAKRPVNIRNIHMTGNSPTVAGNYLNRYEYISTTSPEANDPFFVKNPDKIASSQESPVLHKIENLLSTPPGTARTALRYKNYRLPDRSYITGTFDNTTGKWSDGTVKNRTRIMTRFTAHSGYESMSRGYLDTAHETYSVYNVMTYRNISSRVIHNTQLQAHQGQHGVSTHGEGFVSHGIARGNQVGYGSVRWDGAPSNGNTLILTNYQGKIVTYKIDTSNTHIDGRLHSDGISINVGMHGASADDTRAERLEAVINATTGIDISADSVTIGSYNVTRVYQKFPSRLGNTKIINNITNTTSYGFTYSGYNARVFGEGDKVEKVGFINSEDYTLSVGNEAGQAAKHKYHRNNLERIRFLGDDPTSNSVTFLTASSYDNAFVSHMIPRTDKQYAWITGSLI